MEFNSLLLSSSIGSSGGAEDRRFLKPGARQGNGDFGTSHRLKIDVETSGRFASPGAHKGKGSDTTP